MTITHSYTVFYHSHTILFRFSFHLCNSPMKYGAMHSVEEDTYSKSVSGIYSAARNKSPDLCGSRKERFVFSQNKKAGSNSVVLLCFLLWSQNGPDVQSIIKAGRGNGCASDTYPQESEAFPETLPASFSLTFHWLACVPWPALAARES